MVESDSIGGHHQLGERLTIDDRVLETYSVDGIVITYPRWMESL